MYIFIWIPYSFNPLETWNFIEKIPCIYVFMITPYYQPQENIASELQENLEVMFPRYYMHTYMFSMFKSCLRIWDAISWDNNTHIFYCKTKAFASDSEHLFNTPLFTNAFVMSSYKRLSTLWWNSYQMWKIKTSVLETCFHDCSYSSEANSSDLQQHICCIFFSVA